MVGLVIVGGLCQSASATVITLPSVPQDVLFGASAEITLNEDSAGDPVQVGIATPFFGGVMLLPADSSTVNLLPNTPYLFTFSYDSGTAYFDILGVSLSQSVAGLIPGSSFVLELLNSGTSSTVSGLSLEAFGGGAGPSFIAGIDTTYTTTSNGVFRIPTTSLAGGFELTGTFSFDGLNQPKNGFRVFVESPVPEPATIAFGTALVGGLVCCEARRRRKTAVRQ